MKRVSLSTLRPRAALPLALVLLATGLGALAACDDEEPALPGVLVETGELFGFWYIPGDDTTSTLTLGFFPQDEAGYWTALDDADVLFDASAVYRDAARTQVAWFGTVDGFIEQEVLVDERAASGTLFRTRIAGIEPEEELRLDTGGGGVRAFRFSRRCPLADGAGWFGEIVPPCDVPAEMPAPSLAVDADGGVHLIGFGRGAASASEPCGAQARWTTLHGCEAIAHPIDGDAAFAQLATPDGELLQAWRVGSELRLRTGRPRSDVWTEETVDSGSMAVGAALVGSATQPRLLTVDADQTLRVHRRRGGEWTRRRVEGVDGEAIAGELGGVAQDATGALWLLLRRPDEVAGALFRETSDGSFAEASPEGFDLHTFGSLFIDGRGRPHVLALRGEGDERRAGLLIVDGEASEWMELPSFSETSVVLPRASAPWAVVREVRRQPSETWLAWTEFDGGQVRTRLAHAWSVPPSPRDGEARCWAQEGADGTVAVVRDDARLRVRFADGPAGSGDARFTVAVVGGGQVVDEAWGIDCTDRCEPEVPMGAVPALRLEPDAGWRVAERVRLLGVDGLEAMTAPTPAEGFPLELPLDAAGWTLEVSFERETP